jgi:hypothetical protein
VMKQGLTVRDKNNQRTIPTLSPLSPGERGDAGVTCALHPAQGMPDR